MAGAARRLAVERHEGLKARRLAADDGERHRQAERGGAHHRLWRAADRDPDRDFPRRARIDAEIVERCAVQARPGDSLALPELQKQVELLGEERIVISEV